MNPNNPVPSTLSFDVWKTLVRSNPEFKPERNRLVAHMLGYADVDYLSQVTREVDVTIDSQSDETGIQHGPHERLGEICTRLGVHADAVVINKTVTAAQELFLQYPLLLNEEDLVETLEALRAQYQAMCITSNTGFIDGEYMRKALRNIGILDLMDTAFFSNEHGCAKPSKQFFNKVLRWANGEPDSIIHIGDNIEADYNGARRLGMQAILLTPSGDATNTAPTIREAVNRGLL